MFLFSKIAFSKRFFFLSKTINFKNGYENIDFKPLLEDKVVNGANILFHFVGFGGSNASLVLSNKRS